MIKVRRRLVSICLSVILCVALLHGIERSLDLDLRVYDLQFDAGGSWSMQMHDDVKIEPILYTKSISFKEKQAELFRKARHAISLVLDSKLTEADNVSIAKCVSKGVTKARKPMRIIDRTRLRLDFLTNTSVVVDVGGNIGEDAAKIVDRYRPKSYIILEPLQPYYFILSQKFSERKQVKVMNVGLSVADGIFYAAEAGEHGEATSMFSAEEGGQMLNMENTTKFFLNLRLGEFKFDLITINCGGCELDVLESLIASDMIRHFRHVQFRTNSDLDYIEKPIERHCRIQQFLQRAFDANFLYESTWNSWHRKVQDFLLLPDGRL